MNRGIQMQSTAIPAEVPPNQREKWMEGFNRTLAEAVRRAATKMLDIEARELSSTTRALPFGYPEVVLYDSVAGGAGYCQLVQRRGLRELLSATIHLLDCDCDNSCRLCLRDFDNERFWDDFKRKPVLAWLKKVLGQPEAPNPFSRFHAVQLNVTDPVATFWAELDSASHAVVVAPSLFDFTRDGSEEGFAVEATTQFVKRLVGWMTGGRTLELALLAAPGVGSDHPQSLALAKWLEPCLAANHLKLWKLPPNFDALNWPRLILNPGKDSSRCLFSRVGLNIAFLKQPLVLPLWRSPGLSTGELGKLRLDWEPLPARLTEPGSKTTPRYGPNRRDFHDRRLVFIPDAKRPQKRVTVLLTGGIDRYLEPRFECGVIVHET